MTGRSAAYAGPVTTELTELSDELGADLIVRTATGYRLPLTDAQVDVKAVLRVLDDCEQGGARRRGARDGRREQRGFTTVSRRRATRRSRGARAS